MANKPYNDICERLTKSQQLEKRFEFSTTLWKSFWSGFAASAGFFVIAAIMALAWAVANPDMIRSFLNSVPQTMQAPTKQSP